MPNRSSEISMTPFPFLVLVLLLALGWGLVVNQASLSISVAFGLLVVVLLISFFNIELALHIVLLSMILSPEVVVGGAAGVAVGKPMQKGDALVLRLEDIIVVAVGLGWFARSAVYKELGLIRKTMLNLPIFVYIGCLAVATLLGIFLGNVNPLRGFFFTLKYIEYFVVFFLTVNYIHEEAQIRRLLTTAFLACAISAVIGIAQIPSGQRVGAPFEGERGEPNTFGGYLVFMLALILGQALTAATVPVQVGWYAFGGLAAIPLLYTLSRSSWLAAIPMLLTLIVLSPRRLILMTGLGAIMILGPLAFPKAVVDRYNYTLNAEEDRSSYRLGESRFDQSTAARFDSFIYGIKGWMQRPILGYGVTGFAFMDAQYVRVLVETGLVGLATFLWLLWRILGVAWESHKRAIGSRFEGLTLGYLAGAIGMFTHGVGANTFIIVRIMEPFWFMTGIIALLPLLQRNATPSRELRSQSAGKPVVSREIVRRTS